ncbi:Bor family protein [Pseudoteredinibacter isoporae]|uniref:Bor family protein n=1 Tax=Pseudoteredinibacter isoporae TaxID=570281 RepID=UPI0031028CFF
MDSKIWQRTLTVFALLALCACTSVTIRPNGGEKLHSEPDYIDSKPFYLAGLIGEHTVDVNEVCEGAEIEQMQTLISSNDYVLSLLTLFIYSPRTAKVWCRYEEA